MIDLFHYIYGYATTSLAILSIVVKVASSRLVRDIALGACPFLSEAPDYSRRYFRCKFHYHNSPIYILRRLGPYRLVSIPLCGRFRRFILE